LRILILPSKLIHAAGVALIIIMDYYVQFCLLFWSQVMICDVAKAFFLANVIGILLAIVFIILGCIRKHPPGLAVALDTIMLVIMLALTGFEAYFIYTTVNSLNVFFYAGCTVSFFVQLVYIFV
jgi:hypothetical protein